MKELWILTPYALVEGEAIPQVSQDYQVINYRNLSLANEYPEPIKDFDGVPDPNLHVAYILVTDAVASAIWEDRVYFVITEQDYEP